MLQITFYITYKSHVRLSYTSWKQWKYYFSIRKLAIIFRKTSQLSFRSWFYFFFLCCSLRKSVLVIFMQHRKPSSIFPRRNNPNLRLLRRKPTALFSNNEVQRQENYDPKAFMYHLWLFWLTRVEVSTSTWTVSPKKPKITTIWFVFLFLGKICQPLFYTNNIKIKMEQHFQKSEENKIWAMNLVQLSCSIFF